VLLSARKTAMRMSCRFNRCLFFLLCQNSRKPQNVRIVVDEVNAVVNRREAVYTEIQYEELELMRRGRRRQACWNQEWQQNCSVWREGYGSCRRKACAV